MKKNKPVVCVDGFSMSVQADSTAYCTPRHAGADFYDEVEVGFPNQEESLLSKHAEDPDDLTGTVYGWVPRMTVINVIAKHGGMVSGELPAGFPVLMVRQS
jgi:hypothetical protein